MSRSIQAVDNFRLDGVMLRPHGVRVILQDAHGTLARWDKLFPFVCRQANCQFAVGLQTSFV
jgi:hypothetical protein